MLLLGKTIFNDNNKFIVKLNIKDEILVEEFCKECDLLNFKNNSSLEKMKWHFGLENGGWFAAMFENKIYSLAGYHKFDINSYRVLFRGAQLPGHNPTIVSKNIFSVMVHWTYLLHEQIKEIMLKDQNAKIYISTNVEENVDAPTSHRLSKSMAPLLAKRGLLNLEKKDIILYNTRQHLWRLNVEQYQLMRSSFFAGQN